MVMMFVFDAVLVWPSALGFGFTCTRPGCSCWRCCSACSWSTMAAFSVATALVTKDISGFAAIINGINLPVLLLGRRAPARSRSGPLWMRVLAHFNPLYYLVDAARASPPDSFGDGRGLAGVRRARAALRAGAGLGHGGLPAGCVLTPGPGGPARSHAAGGGSARCDSGGGVGG